MCGLVSWVVADYAERCLPSDLDQSKILVTIGREESSLEVYVSYLLGRSAYGDVQIAERLGTLEIFTTDCTKDAP